MTYFKTFKLKNEKYDYLVIAKNYESSLSNIIELEKHIKQDQANILFDLIVKNGTNSNRFIEYKYQKNTSNPGSFAVVNAVSDNIKAITSKFLQKNQNLIDNSVLPKSLKYILKNNLL